MGRQGLQRPPRPWPHQRAAKAEPTTRARRPRRTRSWRRRSSSWSSASSSLSGDHAMASTICGFQGEPGAYSEAAAHEIFSSAGRIGDVPLALRRSTTVFAIDAAGTTEYAAVPVENTLGGSIHGNYDLLLRYHGKAHILGEHSFRVRHTLLALPGVAKADVKKAMSHPQALAQTDTYPARRGSSRSRRTTRRAPPSSCASRTCATRRRSRARARRRSTGSRCSTSGSRTTRTTSRASCCSGGSGRTCPTPSTARRRSSSSLASTKRARSSRCYPPSPSASSTSQRLSRGRTARRLHRRRRGGLPPPPPPTATRSPAGAPRSGGGRRRRRRRRRRRAAAARTSSTPSTLTCWRRRAMSA